MSDNAAGTKKNDAENSIVQRIFIAVILGFIVGIGCLVLRVQLGESSQAWSILYSLLFVDVTSAEGTTGVGLFYIAGQLFMHALQVAIVPLVLPSVG